MKRTVFALLSVLVLAGCYETTTMPEGLTADNFYIGTFTFTDFEDKSIPDFTFTFTEDRFKVTDGTGITYFDTKNVMNVRDDMGLIGSEFINSKNFSFSGNKWVFYSLEPVEEGKYESEISFKATEKGFSVYLFIREFQKGSGEILQTNQICFSNYDTKFIKDMTDSSDWNDTDNVKFFASSNTFTWNGKKYKSVSK
ncbi:MAG: membrane lipoprotein lipid attachment site-containing protein [Spirochaetia bacterium]|nr:membrane lipoprotein lipid attachment site-containing protein [Spirochaetia bacterium]